MDLTTREAEGAANLPAPSQTWFSGAPQKLFPPILWFLLLWLVEAMEHEVEVLTTERWSTETLEPYHFLLNGPSTAGKWVHE